MQIARIILIIVEFLYVFIFIFSLTRRRNYLAQLFSLAVLAGMVYVGGYFFELASQYFSRYSEKTNQSFEQRLSGFSWEQPSSLGWSCSMPSG